MADISKNILDSLAARQVHLKDTAGEIYKLNESILKLEQLKLETLKEEQQISDKIVTINEKGKKTEIALDKLLEKQKKSKKDLLHQEKELNGLRGDYEKHLIRISKKEVDLAKQIKERDKLEKQIKDNRKENNFYDKEELEHYEKLNKKIKEQKKDIEKSKQLNNLLQKQKLDTLDQEEKSQLKILKTQERTLDAKKQLLKIQEKIKKQGDKSSDADLKKEKELKDLITKREASEKKAEKQYQKNATKTRKYFDQQADALKSSIVNGVTSALSALATSKIISQTWDKSISSYQAGIKGMMVDYTSNQADPFSQVQDTAKSLGNARVEFIKLGLSGEQAVETYSSLYKDLRGFKSPVEIGRMTENVGFLGHALQISTSEVVKFQATMENSMGMSRQEAESSFVAIQKSAVSLIETLGNGSFTVGDFTNSLMSVVDAAPGYNKNVSLMASATKNLIVQSKKYGATQKEAMSVAQKGMGAITGATAPEWAKLQAAQKQLQMIGSNTDIKSLKDLGYGGSAQKISKYLQSSGTQDLSEYEKMKTISAFGSGTKANMRGMYNVIQDTVRTQGTQGGQAVLAEQYLGGDYGASAMMIEDIRNKDFDSFSKNYEDLKPTDTIDQLKTSNKFLEQLASKSGDNSITQKLGAIMEEIHTLFSPVMIPIIEAMNMFLGNDVGKWIVKAGVAAVAVKGLIGAWRLYSMMKDKMNLGGKGGGILGNLGIGKGLLGTIGKTLGIAAGAYLVTKMASSSISKYADTRDTKLAKSEVSDALSSSGGDMGKFSKKFNDLEKYWKKDTSYGVLGIGGRLSKQFSDKEMNTMRTKTLKESGLLERYNQYQENLKDASTALTFEGRVSDYTGTKSSMAQAKDLMLGMEEFKVADIAKRGKSYRQNEKQWESLVGLGASKKAVEFQLQQKGGESEVLKTFTSLQQRTYNMLDKEGKKTMIQEQTMELLKSDILSGRTTEEEVLDTLLRQEKIAQKSLEIETDIKKLNEVIDPIDMGLDLFNNIGSSLLNYGSNFLGSLGLGSPASKIQAAGETKEEEEFDEAKRNADGTVTMIGKKKLTLPANVIPHRQLAQT